MRAYSIWSFWFEKIAPSHWYKKDAEFDNLVRARFEVVHRAAREGELFGWRTESKGRLAEIIVLDQFSRNMFRDQAEAFEYDPMALVLAQEAIDRGIMDQLEVREAAFILMPIMHSESLVVHEAYAPWFERPGLSGTLDYEQQHRRILDRFGRYPHRNAVLGRASSKEELAFLQGPASSF